MKAPRQSNRVLSVIRLAVAVGLGGATAHASLVVGESQFSSGNVLPGPITAVTGDLLETSVSSFSGEKAASLVRNGTTGTAHESSVPNPAATWDNATTTYDFDLSSNVLGYSISEVRVFSGWHDARAGQSFDIHYSVVGNAAFTLLGTVSQLPANGSLLTRTYDSLGASILTGVDQLRFQQNNNGLAGTGTVFREFDVIGAATAIPEPATASVFAGLIGLAAGVCFSRRGRRGAGSL